MTTTATRLLIGFVLGAMLVFVGAFGGRGETPRPKAAVSLGANSKLVYTPDALGNVIPDFSQCGYQAGATKIPDVPVLETVQPVSGDAGAIRTPAWLVRWIR